MTETINELPPIEERPLVTFALFSYNQEKYIREALKGALEQTYEPLEIVISDDCSTDNTFQIIKEMTAKYSGQHKVIVNCNVSNLGLAGHVNHVMSLVSGELIVVAAGDDISFPHRVETIAKYWLSLNKESGSIFSKYQTIDEMGNIRRHDKLGEVIKYLRSEKKADHAVNLTEGISGCTHAWTADIFKVFGPLNPYIIQEDITIPLRSFLIGSVNQLPDELVLYRLTKGSLSRHQFFSYQERFTKMARYWRGRMANYEQYRCDVLKITNNGNIKKFEIEWINEIIKEKEDEAVLKYRFFKGNLTERIGVIFDRSFKVKLYMRLKLLAIAFIPQIYGF